MDPLFRGLSGQDRVPSIVMGKVSSVCPSFPSTKRVDMSSWLYIRPKGTTISTFPCLVFLSTGQKNADLEIKKGGLFFPLVQKVL